ncbi:unnamed protein product, partial [Ectocarpus sp. 13 AM-2016]
PGCPLYIACFLCCRTAVQFLSSEGHLYSTIDDDHYRSTET